MKSLDAKEEIFMQQMFTQEFINYQKNKWIELRLHEKINDKKNPSTQKKVHNEWLEHETEKGTTNMLSNLLHCGFHFFLLFKH